jgi:hypothetical protein
MTMNRCVHAQPEKLKAMGDQVHFERLLCIKRRKTAKVMTTG